MTRLPTLLLLAAGAAAARAGPSEDAAHRADRVRTQQLNRAANAGRRADTRDEANGEHARAQADYRQARADYASRLEDWRRRVAACQAGYRDACDR